MKSLRDMTEPELRILFDEISREVKRRLPRRSLFMLLAFDPEGVVQYVSNANRGDMIKAMREGARRLQEREDVPR